MEIDYRKLRHDLNSLFFKLETSTFLLEEETNQQEKEKILNILKKVEKKVKIFLNAILIENENFKAKIQKINISELLNTDENVVIYTDKGILEIAFDILFLLNKKENFNPEILNNKIVINGNFELEDEIEKYLILSLNKFSKKGNLKIDINREKAVISW